MSNSLFKLKGLNKPWRSAGFHSVFATVETGKEDWFHCGFDEKIFPADRLKVLFDMFKNTDDNLWHDKNHQVKIEYRDDKPIITELILDDI